MNKTIDKKTIKKGLLPYLFLALIMLGVFYVVNVMNLSLIHIYSPTIYTIRRGEFPWK